MTMKVIKNKNSYGLAMTGMDLLELLPFEVTEAIDQIADSDDDVHEFFDPSNVIYLSAQEMIDATDKDVSEVLATVQY